MGFFDKLKNKISDMFGGEGRLDDDFYDELEEALILGDVGATAASDIVESLRTHCRKEGIKNRPGAKEALRGILRDMLDSAGDREMNIGGKPSVVLMIGVNGAGKTTTAGKLAAAYKRKGKRVLLCAADTFRAAAADQLEIWAERSGADLVRQNEGADPAAVLFDAIAAAKARNTDILICDTAGRLHNKQNLMNELHKISRVLDRELPDAPRETLLVIDATTGQNGLAQVKSFMDTAGVTGLVLTKLDGTAKGGVVLAVAGELGVPVKWVGQGEKLEDLAQFDPESFVKEIVV